MVKNKKILVTGSSGFTSSSHGSSRAWVSRDKQSGSFTSGKTEEGCSLIQFME